MCRNWSAPAGGQPAAQPAAAATGDPAANWDRAPAARDAGTGNWDTAWDPTLPAIPSAFVSGDPIAIIKWKEILDFLEAATDRCEDVANVLEGVVVKHA